MQIVPTSDADVKKALRQLNEPICYFGETQEQRRERLKRCVQKQVMSTGNVPAFATSLQSSIKTKDSNSHFFYKGKTQLELIRQEIAKISLKQAASRIEEQKYKRATTDALVEEEEIDAQNVKLQDVELQMCQFADISAVTKGCFSPNDKLFATAGGSGVCKIWSIPSCQQVSSMPYNSRVNCITFHPQSTKTLDPKSAINIASGASDGTIHFWSCDIEPEVKDNKQKNINISAHQDRVNKVLFHPFINIISSVSHDKTWKIWDLEKQQEVLSQTGHSKAIYAQSIHPDGSILFTGDLGGFGMLWDLRTGKSILPIQGHVKQLISSAFSDNGYHLATGSDDNTVKIWDIRRKESIYTIPAHTKLVSDIKFQPNGSKFLMTSSYDKTCKIWSVKDWSLQKTLKVNECKVTGINITNDLRYIATTTMDREWMLWCKSGRLFDDI